MSKFFTSFINAIKPKPMTNETIGTILKIKTMRDAISIERATLLHPKVRQDVVSCIEKAEAQFPANMAIRIVQGLRTIDEQNAIYAQGRTKPGKIVTNSRGGQSYHCYGLAVDIALLFDKDGNGSFETLSWDTKSDSDKDGKVDWMEVVDIFESAGWTWGGRFHSIPDAPHFEKHFGIHWKRLFEMYNSGNFIPGTKYIEV